MSLDDQEEDLELKSPVITDKDGLTLLMSFKKTSKLDRNESKSSVFWVGEQKITDTSLFCYCNSFLVAVLLLNNFDL